jgi:hypothetical protein
MTRVRNACVLAVIAVIVTIVATMDTGGATSGYSAYSIRGTYRITFTGLSLPSMSPESGVGVFVADGTGHITGTEVLNSGGKVCPDVTVTATYTVNVIGIGTLSADFTSPTPGCSGHFNSSLLVLDGGNVVKSVGTDPGFVTLSEEWRRE